MGRSCNTHGGDENCIPVQELFRKVSRDHFGDLGVDGKAILKWILKELVSRMCTEFI
jgi:hypothetical protein